jgi:hypothetical protein
MEGHSNLTLTNHVNDLQFTASATSEAPADSWGPASAAVPAQQSSQIQSVQRGISRGTTFTVSVVSSIAGLPIVIDIKVTGTFADSDMWVEASLGGETTPALSDYGTATVNAHVSTASTTLGYALTLQRIGGGGHDDLLVTVAATDQSSAANHVLMPYTACNFFPLLDVWGQGRVVMKDGQTSGFREAYNLDQKDQTIWNGPDAGKPIPNKIPVDSHDNPRFPIPDGSVLFMTTMGSPIVDATAKEMMRVLDPVKGVVYLYQPSSSSLATFKAAMRPGFVQKRVAQARSELPLPFSEPSPQATFFPVYVFGWQNHPDQGGLATVDASGQHEEL